MLYKIRGNNPLSGTLQVQGNKNAALPCLAACLLTREAVVLRNIPDLQDVKVMLQILKHVGAQVQRLGPNEFKIQASTITSHSIPYELSTKMRASILLAGPLLSRCARASIPPPGGDVIGRRRLDTHVFSLSMLGAQYALKDNIEFSAQSLRGAHVFQDEASVTATENTIMAACLAQGTTVIENAACEPHVQDLCNMINAMGGTIRGIGSNVLTIEGCKELGGTEYRIGPDFMEVGSFIGLATVTKSALDIQGVNPMDLKMTEISFSKLGITWSYKGDTLQVPAVQSRTIQPDLGDAIPSISDAPWPGFPPDLTSVALVTATQTKGTILIHEKMFESRMFFVDKLVAMGARIVLCDPHRAVISGPSQLYGTRLTSPDVRAGMAMVLAALCAKGESIIENVYAIERGYQDLQNRLIAIGADIEKADIEKKN